MKSEVHRVLFVSDVHLEPSLPQRTRRFQEFLRREASTADALFILGDLIDFWVGPGQEERPAFRELVQAFRRLADAGVRIAILPGNRDFLLRANALDAWGVEVLADPTRLDLGGRKVLITHGDCFMPFGSPSHLTRRLLQNRTLGRIFLCLPFSLRLAVGRGFQGARAVWTSLRRRVRDRIRRARGLPPLGDRPARLRLWRGRIRKLLATSVDLIIAGHYHAEEEIAIPVDGESRSLYLLGCWNRHSPYLEWADGQWRLLRSMEE